MNQLKVMLLLGCVAASFSSLADSKAVDSKAANSTTLKYGVEAQYPPFESKNTKGQLQGFDIDVGNAVCAAANLKCEWVETSFDSLIPALAARKFDAINSAMNVTEQRRKTIDFTHVIYRLPSKLIAKKESGLLPSVDSLRGKHVGVLQGSIQESFAMIHWAPKGVDVVAYQDQNQAYLDLSSGRLDATLVLAPAGQIGFLSRPEGKDYQFVGDSVQDDKILGSGIAYGLRKGDSATLEKLNQAIDKVKQDGQLKQLASKYFGDLEVSVK